MEKIDRAYQWRVLEAAAFKYSQKLLVGGGELAGRSGSEVAVNCAYLEEHGLLAVNWLGHRGVTVQFIQATAKGLDYLANDGGLSAQLNVITVRLDSETLRELFIDRVTKAAGDSTVKEKLVNEIKGLPAEGLKEMAKAALDAGLQSLPDLIKAVSGWMHNL